MELSVEATSSSAALTASWERVVNFAVPKWFYDARNAPNETDVLAPLRQLTCSMDAEDPPETVLRRANGGSRSVYDPVHNNCFHFAFYCKTGRQYYGKVTLVLDTWVAVFMACHQTMSQTSTAQTAAPQRLDSPQWYLHLHGPGHLHLDGGPEVGIGTYSNFHCQASRP
jgi:hypothetical protein